MKINKIYLDPVIATINPFEMHKELKSKNIELTNGGIRITSSLNQEVRSGEVLDITTWLKQAAAHYHLSGDIRDYVVAPVPVIPTDLPNRNGVGFPLRELMGFMPEYGMLSYKTWKGQPTHYEHKNDDITKAKGVIADTSLRQIQGYGEGKIYKLMMLLAWDRTKDPDLANRILAGDINTYSMGANANNATCSYCGSDVGRCYHISKSMAVPFYEKDGHLVHKVMHGIKGFECSAVEQPAWLIAQSDTVINVDPSRIMR